MKLRVLICAVLVASAARAEDFQTPLPSADQIVAKMMQRDDDRQAALAGYTALRRYMLENVRHNKWAEMLVRLTCLGDGSKHFELLSSTGWGGVREHVFPRLLKAEAEASEPGARGDSRITPENYSFKVLGQQRIRGRPAYEIDVTPKKPKKYLIRGTIWIDTQDFAVVQMRGEPAKNPSFWTKSVHFTHSYEKHGLFWFPASDESVSDVRLFGATRLRIEYFDYAPKATEVAAWPVTGIRSPGKLALWICFLQPDVTVANSTCEMPKTSTHADPSTGQPPSLAESVR